MSAPDVVGPAEARALIGVGRRQFANLAARPDFPPARDLEIGRVWDRAEVLAWRRARDRQDPAVRQVLDEYRRSGNVSAAARAAGVARTTALRWLHDLDAR